MEVLLYRLIQGEDIALVSDNGTPVICDPGSLFVAAAHGAGIPVRAIPGPSTVTAVTAISGFSGDTILFEGCLPSTSRYLIQYLSNLRTEQRTLVFHIDPRSLTKLLKILVQILPRRWIAIAMDLTTSRETLLRGYPGELLEQIGPVLKDSAVTVVIEGYRVGSHPKVASERVARTNRLRGA
jgi:16S rRNA (cytidine1402-2'-O)-methyltransferase